MKTTIASFVLLTAAFVLLAVEPGFTQEKAPVKVTSSEVVTGVVLVHVQKGEKALDLQCNEGAGSCAKLPAGNYLMVELPKNTGLYDCKNVEIYRGDQNKPDAAQKVGAYCVVE
jgi:hypothetical protein